MPFFSVGESPEEADSFWGVPSPSPLIPPPGAQLGSKRAKREGGAGVRDHPASSLGLALHGANAVGDRREDAGPFIPHWASVSLKSLGGRGWLRPPLWMKSPGQDDSASGWWRWNKNPGPLDSQAEAFPAAAGKLLILRDKSRFMGLRPMMQNVGMNFTKREAGISLMEDGKYQCRYPGWGVARARRAWAQPGSRVRCGQARGQSLGCLLT